MNTARFIPGATIHGWFAHAHGNFDSDEFRWLFTSGAARFLNANPAAGGKRAHVIPHSVRQKKDSKDQYVDLTVTPHAKEIRRKGGWCDIGKLAQGNLMKPNPETTIHYHHARAEDDLFQRALGPEEARVRKIDIEKAGAFFQYEALLPGQRFVGEIHGNAASLALVAQRSIRARARIRWLNSPLPTHGPTKKSPGSAWWRVPPCLAMANAGCRPLASRSKNWSANSIVL